MEPSRVVGDESRRIRVELPPTFEDLEHLCLTSFGMVGPVTLYKNGIASLTSSDYASIQSGDTFVVVDSRGNAINAKDFFVSTYDHDYDAKPIPPRNDPIQPQNYRKIPDSRTFRTTEDDYQAWPIEKRMQVEAAKAPQTLPFKGSTEYRSEYSPHKIPPREAGPPVAEYRKIPDNRNFAPESSKFQPWEIPKREDIPAAQSVKSLPFNARSSYQDDYPAHAVQQRPTTPAQGWKPNGIRFTATSTSKHDYRKWDLPPKDAPYQAARPPPSLPFNARTTAQDDFQTHAIPTRAQQPKFASYTKTPDNRNFASESTQYKAWELPKRQQPAVAQQPVKTLPFTATSSYQDDYVPHQVQPRHTPVPPPYQPPKIPFNARTVTQDDFQRHALPRKIYITLEPARN